jgi:hypothetical protein
VGEKKGATNDKYREAVHEAIRWLLFLSGSMGSILLPNFLLSE